MNNIFKDAYFGKSYKTRDGRKAIYKEKDIDKPGSYVWIEGRDGIFYIGKDGFYLDNKKESQWDIVSELEEEIDENHLDKLSKEYSLWLADEPLQEQRYIDGFKAGYKAAKKGE